MNLEYPERLGRAALLGIGLAGSVAATPFRYRMPVGEVFAYTAETVVRTGAFGDGRTTLRYDFEVVAREEVAAGAVFWLDVVVRGESDRLEIRGGRARLALRDDGEVLALESPMLDDPVDGAFLRALRGFFPAAPPEPGARARSRPGAVHSPETGLPGSFTFREIVSTFAAGEVVVGPHGREFLASAVETRSPGEDLPRIRLRGEARFEPLFGRWTETRTAGTTTTRVLGFPATVTSETIVRRVPPPPVTAEVLAGYEGLAAFGQAAPTP